MPSFEIDPLAISRAGDQFGKEADQVQTVLNHVKATGLGDPSPANFCSTGQPGVKVFGSYEAVNDYQVAASAIAESVVQLAASLRCMDEKLRWVADLYERLDDDLTIR